MRSRHTTPHTYHKGRPPESIRRPVLQPSGDADASDRSLCLHAAAFSRLELSDNYFAQIPSLRAHPTCIRSQWGSIISASQRARPFHRSRHHKLRHIRFSSTPTHHPRACTTFVITIITTTSSHNGPSTHPTPRHPRLAPRIPHLVAHGQTRRRRLRQIAPQPQPRRRPTPPRRPRLNVHLPRLLSNPLHTVLFWSDDAQRDGV